MQINIPFREKESKSDVNLSIVRNNSSLSSDEETALNIVSDVFVNGTIQFLGNNQTVFLSIRKDEQNLIVDINDELIDEDI